MKLEPTIISAPFGNYITLPNATSTVGSFTLNPRAGFLKRIWKVLETVRYYQRPHSWINKLGLPNPGIHEFLNSGTFISEKIISIYGFSKNEWNSLVELLEIIDHPAIEFNLSCPNVSHKQVLEDVVPAIAKCPEKVIAKLPPIDWFKLAVPLYLEGVQVFHLCNTIPTPGGGMSGKILKQYSLWAIREFRQKYGSTVKIIGGGGITSMDDVYDYIEAGADHFALGSMLFNPFNRKVAQEIAKKMWNYSYFATLQGMQSWKTE